MSQSKRAPLSLSALSLYSHTDYSTYDTFPPVNIVTLSPLCTALGLELTLSRCVLAKLLAIRTMHGDFAWYHRKFKHDDSELLCSCEKNKSPDYLIHCPRMRRWFRQWPARPAWPPPDNNKEGIVYLQQLLSNPEDFADFIRLAKEPSF